MSEAALMSSQPAVVLPTQDELPYDDGMPMESARHVQQMNLLIDSLHSWLAARPDGYAGGNMFIYFSHAQIRNQDFRGPDFYLVLGVPKTERKSWVVWEEGKGPDVIIELLSESTAQFDKTEKKTVYQDQLRVSEYFWYDPFDPEDWAGFKLDDGIYKPIAPDALGLLSPLLQLALVRWQGVYGDVETTWLRWATPSGELLPTRAEAAQREAATAQQRADAAERRATAAEVEIARLQALLRNQKS